VTFQRIYSGRTRGLGHPTESCSTCLRLHSFSTLVTKSFRTRRLPTCMQESSRRKRQQVVVACNACRRKKIKVCRRRRRSHIITSSLTVLICHFVQCDGARPTCRGCTSKQSHCVYEADPDATPIIALRRKYDQLKLETDGKNQLLNDLRNKPEPESFQLLRRIRSDADLHVAFHQSLANLSPDPELNDPLDGENEVCEPSASTREVPPRLPQGQSYESTMSDTAQFSPTPGERLNSRSPVSGIKRGGSASQQPAPM